MINILFIAKKDDNYAELAIDYLKNKKIKLKAIYVEKKDSKILKKLNWQGDYIISYLCPFLIPSNILKQAKRLAINFHPGPPEYPGIGCTNYALYNEEKHYGVTCHIMSSKIDDGEILDVIKFKIRKNDNLYSLTMNSYKYMFKLYLKIIKKILVGKDLKSDINYVWKGEAKTRKQFLKFLELSTDMSKREIKKRIFCTTYPGFEPAHFHIKGIKFFGDIDE